MLSSHSKPFASLMAIHLLLPLFLPGFQAQMFGWPQGMPVQQVMNQGRPPTPVPVPVHMQTMYAPGGGMNNNRAGGSSPFSFNGIMSNIKNFFTSHPNNGQQMPQIPPHLLSNPAFRQQLEQVLLTNPALAQSVMQSLGQQNAAMLHAGMASQVQSRLTLPNPQPLTNGMSQHPMNPVNNPQSRIFNQGNTARDGDDIFLLTAPFQITNDAVSSLINVANQEPDTRQRAKLLKQMLEQVSPQINDASPSNSIVVQKVVPKEQAAETHAQWASAATNSIRSKALPNIVKAIKQLPENPDRSQLLALLKDQGLLQEPSLLSQASTSKLQSTSSRPTSIQAILKANDEAKLRLALKQNQASTSSNSGTGSKASLPALEKIPNDLAERLRGLGLNPEFLPDLIRSANLVTNTASAGSESLNHVASGSSSITTSQNVVPVPPPAPQLPKTASTAASKDDKGMQGLRAQLQSLPADELTKVQNLIQIVVGKPQYLPRLLKEDLPANIRQILLTVQKLKFPDTMTTTPIPAPVHITTATTPASSANDLFANALNAIASDAKSSAAPSHAVTVQSQPTKVSTQSSQPPSDIQDTMKQASTLSVSKSEDSSSDNYIPLLYWLQHSGKGSNIFSSTARTVSFNPQKSSPAQNQIASSSDQKLSLAHPTSSNGNIQSSTQSPRVEQPLMQQTSLASIIKNIPIEILGSLSPRSQPAQKPDVDVVHAGTNTVFKEMRPADSAFNQMYGLRTSPKPTIQFETTTPPPKVHQLPVQQKQSSNLDEATIPLAALAAALEPKALSTFLQSMQKKQEARKDGPNLFKIELSQESLPTSVPLSAVFNSVNLNSSGLVSFLNRFSNSPALARMLPSSTTVMPSTAPPPSYVSLLLPSSTASSLTFFPFMQESRTLQASGASTTLSPELKTDMSTTSPSSVHVTTEHGMSSEEKHSHPNKKDHGKMPNKHQSLSPSSSEEKESDVNEKHSKQPRKENKESHSLKDGERHFKHGASSEEDEKNDFAHRNHKEHEQDREASHSERMTVKHHSSSFSEEQNEHTNSKSSGHLKHGKDSHSQKDSDRHVKHRPSSSEERQEDSREKFSSSNKHVKEVKKPATWNDKYRPSVSSSSEEKKGYFSKKSLHHHQKDIGHKHSPKSTDWPMKSRSSASTEDEDEDEEDKRKDLKNVWKHQKENKYPKTEKHKDQAHKSLGKDSLMEHKKSTKQSGHHQKDGTELSSSEEQPQQQNKHKDDWRQHHGHDRHEHHSSNNNHNVDSTQIQTSSSNGQTVEIHRKPDKPSDEHGSRWHDDQYRYRKQPQLSPDESKKLEVNGGLNHRERNGEHLSGLNGDHTSEKDLQTQFVGTPSMSEGWEPVNPFYKQSSSLKNLGRVEENETVASPSSENRYPPRREENEPWNPNNRYPWQNPQRAVVLPEGTQPYEPHQHLQDNHSVSKENKKYDFEKLKSASASASASASGKSSNQQISDDRYRMKAESQNSESITDFRTVTNPPTKYDWAVTPDYVLVSTSPTSAQSTLNRESDHPTYHRPDDSREDHLEPNPSYMQNHYSPKTMPSSGSNLKAADESSESRTRYQLFHGRESPCTHKPNSEPSRRDSSEMYMGQNSHSLMVKEGDNTAGSQIYQITSPFGKDKLLKINAPLPKGRSYKPSMPYSGKLDKLDGKFIPQSQLLSPQPSGDELSGSKFKTLPNFKNSLWGFQGITDNSFNNYEVPTQPSILSTTSGQYGKPPAVQGVLPNYPETTTIKDTLQATQTTNLLSLAQITPYNATNLFNSKTQNITSFVGNSNSATNLMGQESQVATDKSTQWSFWPTESNLPQATTVNPLFKSSNSEGGNMFYYNSNFTEPMSVFNLPITESPEDAILDDENDTITASSTTSSYSTLFRPFYGSNSLWPTFSSLQFGSNGQPQLYNATSTQYSLEDEVITNHTDVFLNGSSAKTGNEGSLQTTNSSVTDDNDASGTDLKHVEMTPPHVDVYTRIHNPHKSSPNVTSAAFVPPVRKINFRPSGKLKPTSKQEVVTSSSTDNAGDEMFTDGNWPKSQSQSQNQNLKQSDVTSTSTTSTTRPRKIKLRWSSDKLGSRKVLNSKPVNFYNFYQPNSETE